VDSGLQNKKYKFNIFFIDDSGLKMTFLMQYIAFVYLKQKQYKETRRR
jgi:hypothetical protein